MSVFSRFTRKSGKADDALYAQVWREVESKNVDEGLWARLWAENKGHEEKTKAAYLNERVKQLQESVKVLDMHGGSPPDTVARGEDNSGDFIGGESTPPNSIGPEGGKLPFALPSDTKVYIYTAVAFVGLQIGLVAHGDMTLEMIAFSSIPVRFLFVAPIAATRYISSNSLIDWLVS